MKKDTHTFTQQCPLSQGLLCGGADTLQDVPTDDPKEYPTKGFTFRSSGTLQICLLGEDPAQILSHADI